jgi:hypothetical protein
MFTVNDLIDELKTYEGRLEVKVSVGQVVRGEYEVQKAPIERLKFEDDEVLIELE